MSMKKTQITRRSIKKDSFQKNANLVVKNGNKQKNSDEEMSKSNHSFQLYEEILAGLSWSA